MPEQKESCVKPDKGPFVESIKGSPVDQPLQGGKEEILMHARVGKPAPDFEASAYLDGGFKNVRLSDFKGKWIVICFYPGDFTFV
jgi:peroxiredoxin (alkyl hydroperoxide reductase subunit C)